METWHYYIIPKDIRDRLDIDMYTYLLHSNKIIAASEIHESINESLKHVWKHMNAFISLPKYKKYFRSTTIKIKILSKWLFSDTVQEIG